MGFLKKIKKKVSERSQELAISRARSQAERQRLKGRTRIVEREAYEKEAIVQARAKGRARAKQPTGFAGFAAGVSKFAGQAPKPVVARRRKGKKRRKMIRRTTRKRVQQQSKRPTIMDFKF